MNYNNIGEKIRYIREKELKQTREEFAEELGISIHTVNRLENSTSKVKDIEVYEKISKVSGYSLNELLLDKKETNDKEKIINQINYFLNILSKDELIFICDNIKRFIRFNHRKDVKTLKDIKRNIGK